MNELWQSVVKTRQERILIIKIVYSHKPIHMLIAAFADHADDLMQATASHPIDPSIVSVMKAVSCVPCRLGRRVKLKSTAQV